MKKTCFFRVWCVAGVSVNKWEPHQTDWLAGSSCPGVIWATMLSWRPMSPSPEPATPTPAKSVQKKFPHRFYLWLRWDGWLLICCHEGTYTWQALRLWIKQDFQHCAMAFSPKKVKVCTVWKQLLEKMAAAEGVWLEIVLPLDPSALRSSFVCDSRIVWRCLGWLQAFGFFMQADFHALICSLTWLLIQWRWCWHIFHSEYFVYSAAGALQLSELFWRYSFIKMQPNKYDEKWELC